MSFVNWIDEEFAAAQEEVGKMGEHMWGVMQPNKQLQEMERSKNQRDKP